MNIEIKDVTGRIIARFLQDIIDELNLTNDQADKLEAISRNYEADAVFWRDEFGCDNVGTKY